MSGFGTEIASQIETILVITILRLFWQVLFTHDEICDITVVVFF